MNNKKINPINYKKVTFNDNSICNNKSMTLPLQNYFICAPTIKPKICKIKPSPIKIVRTKKTAKNNNIKKNNNETKISFSFDEDCSGFEFQTKDTETSYEESISSYRKNLSFIKTYIINNILYKDDSIINFTPSGLFQYSSILQRAININRRHTSLDILSQ